MIRRLILFTIGLAVIALVAATYGGGPNRPCSTLKRSPTATSTPKLAAVSPALLALDRQGGMTLDQVDDNHVRPHSAHGGLTPETVRMTRAVGRPRNLEGSTARPLSPAIGPCG